MAFGLFAAGYFLIGIKGSQRGLRLRIPKQKLLIGTSQLCQIRLQDPGVDARHAMFLYSWGRLTIQALSPRAAVYVNGIKILKVLLKEQDRIRIGEAEFLITANANYQLPASENRVSSRVVPVPSPTIQFTSFQVLHLIGSGGFSDVYLGKALPGGEAIAIKVPNSKIKELPEFLQRFVREAEFCMKLRHAHIVRVFSHGRWNDGTPYFIMEHLPGSTMRQYLSQNPTDIGLAIKTIAELANALQYAHNLGIVHRDLKPENIKQDGNNTFKIMDFGIAKDLNTAGFTSTGMILGTPYYMAPEQAKATNIDHRCDIYSLGAILYEFLTHRVPFPGDPVEVIKKHIYEPLPSPRIYNRQIPPALEQIVQCAMQKDPGRRFSSMQQFAQALASLGEPASTPASMPAVQDPAPPKAIHPFLLTVIEGPFGVGMTIPLNFDNGMIKIGRDNSNYLVINRDSLISRHHATFLASNNQIYLRDENSTNGTYINGRRITGTIRLNPYDQIKVGTTLFLFK